MRISDWSSDVCSSDLRLTSSRSPTSAFGVSVMVRGNDGRGDAPAVTDASSSTTCAAFWQLAIPGSATSAHSPRSRGTARWVPRLWWNDFTDTGLPPPRAQASNGQCGQFPHAREYRETGRSEEHTSELQSLM